MNKITLKSYDESNVNIGIGKIYLNLAVSTLFAMLVAYVTSHTPTLLHLVTGTWVILPIIIIPFAILLIVAFCSKYINQLAAYICLVLFSGCNGLMTAPIFTQYTESSILSIFGGTVALFGMVSAFGYFTKRSLESMGTWLTIALVAVIGVSILNLFIGSSLVATGISIVSVLVFIGFIAYDTQQIKEQLLESCSPATEVLATFSLFLDFMNLFLNLLKLFGDSDD